MRSEKPKMFQWQARSAIRNKSPLHRQQFSSRLQFLSTSKLASEIVILARTLAFAFAFKSRHLLAETDGKAVERSGVTGAIAPPETGARPVKEVYF